MVTIENDILSVSIKKKGAELSSLQHKQTDMEYMWDADPAYWAKSSPVLFPIVGTLKNDTYSFKGETYKLSRHGFARDQVFEVTAQSAASVQFTITSNADTFGVYPFHFSFNIIYTVVADTLKVEYVVKNTGNDLMYFSLGGHPAFKLPLTTDTVYEDYQLVFNKKETTGRWPISENGLIEATPMPLVENTNTLPLRKALFAKDALVIKHLASDEVKLMSSKTPHGLQLTFTGFPFLGLWAAPDADFLCIEPWCGIADSVNSSGVWPHKEGLEKLGAGETFTRCWQVKIF